ncbi:3-phosphoshikimate 1-carboxyvinyltransferase [Gemmobacter megaterium]|uniref:3-phosphoshikimate 1-carboxyvinyltransferase n=1 Tax=Gemmobacter megaterium TaxID=1086013 RepID=A0A1N7M2F5_9RHOB|nr:3-phosphoshikimate 1-carboxyvinyltransferase [Gemmobacter megaterium]GGE09231.1 3-phosphoshikimate 1-carboxyvinyltransferase [Gemmobacter megaterium]SIS80233.1 3-phosphoshikimate 1-carboxyvinyltransferase [Gemmobacter megaterium]
MSAHADPIPMTARASAPLRGVAEVPGDKSISHRALILGAMAVGQTHVTGLLEGQDVLDTAKAMRAFGATVTRLGQGEWTVQGVGVGGFAEPADVIDCGNSGTGVRLIMGAMATSAISTTFTGDASLRKRPMGRVTQPLSLFGTQSYGRQGGRLPMTVIGAADPVPVRYTVPVPSAQVKSAVLLAGLNAPGETVVIEKEATRDHSERMLAGFGAAIHVETAAEGRIITLTGQPELRPQTVAVPRDPSSAAFPVCAALIVPGSDILVPGVSRNPTRDGLFVTLLEMGADITYENPREEGGEPVADLRVRFSGDLTGVETPEDRAASMIDEFPILSVVAACASGITTMRGVKELRVKESDRIDAMARGLEACGVRIEEDEDTLVVHGMGQGNVPGGATCATHLDHRIAMSFLVLGLASKAPVSIDDGAPIATSFPVFEPLMKQLGASIERTHG